MQVRSGTRIEGPFWAGEGTWLLGGQLRHVSAGPHCRLHGEISTTVFNGYANKSHDGFVGHSVIGEWVNLGAGTITSNLKNTYGPIRLDVAGTAHRNRPHQSRRADRRPRQDRDRHAAADRCRGRRRRQSLRRDPRAEVHRPVRMGRRQAPHGSTSTSSSRWRGGSCRAAMSRWTSRWKHHSARCTAAAVRRA